MRAVLPLLVALAGCSPAEESPCVHDPPLTYENFGRGFSGQYCTGCHSSLVPPEHRMDAPKDYDFDTYEGILLWADKVHPAVMDGVMPPGGGPTASDLLLFDEWMACEVLPDAEIYWYGD